jgi:hypothetical protein
MLKGVRNNDKNKRLKWGIDQRLGTLVLLFRFLRLIHHKHFHKSRGLEEPVSVSQPLGRGKPEVSKRLDHGRLLLLLLLLYY